MQGKEFYLTKTFRFGREIANLANAILRKLDEPKNSGRRVAKALEVEFALKMSSAQGGVPIKLPLKDRSISMEYDWHR